MAVTFTDREITALINERKPLPANWQNKPPLQPKRGHNENRLDLLGDNGNQFRLILRESQINKHDFSVILAILSSRSNRFFRLRRYNGKHYRRNRMEGNLFRDFHIHTATERYQERGMREDAYAEATNRYSDFMGAWDCLVSDASVVVPPDAQLDLFAQEVE